MAKQERRISYEAGITRTPSDFLCKDGELAECINLTTDSEELRPVVQPEVYIDKAEYIGGNDQAQTMAVPKIVYVHRHAGYEIFIGCSHVEADANADPPVTAHYELEYGFRDDNGKKYTRKGYLTVGVVTLTSASLPRKVVSVGKTLIITLEESNEDGSNIYYFLWDATTEEYHGIGTEMPEISMDIDLGRSSQIETGQPLAFSIEGFIHHEATFEDPDDVTSDYYFSLYTENDTEYEALKNALNACVNARLKYVAEQKRFAFPFFVRYAIRLYDGSYTKVSQPILLFPSVRHNCDIFFSYGNGDPQDIYKRDWSSPSVNYKPLSAAMFVKINYTQQELDQWSDIISGIDVFVTEPQLPFNINSDWTIVNPFDTDHQGIMVLYDSANHGYETRDITASEWGISAGFVPYFKPTHLTDGDIMLELSKKSIFYRIARIEKSEFSNYAAWAAQLTEKMTQSTLVNLTSQPRLEHDDYFSRNTLSADVMKTYNMRLHLAGVSRKFFEGFDVFTGAGFTSNDSVKYEYVIAIDIKTDTGTRTVVKHVDETWRIMNIWLYYPDPRATIAHIYAKVAGVWKLVYNISLTEHKGLNGAYFLDHLPAAGETLPTGTTENPPDAVDTPETINNHVFVSEPDNPFVFTAKGDVAVGQGDIIGLATQTVALGQEEHGIHPLIVFTTRGTSILRVDNEGYYSRSDELSREVCLRQGSITETDGAVYFVSKKGLMVIVGETTSCVSGRIDGRAFNATDIVSLTGAGNPAAPWSPVISACGDGKSFHEYVDDEDFFMAYDYTDARLLLCNPSYGYVYAYGMIDGTLSKLVLPEFMDASVIDYPDSLMRGVSNKVYTLYGKKREDEVATRQRAFLLTRPMKLAGPDTVASLRELVNVGAWRKKDAQGNVLSSVQTEVWVSDDLYNWYAMTSRFGAAAKYFRIGLYINMLPSERLSGTVIMEQERRTDNQRA